MQKDGRSDFDFLMGSWNVHHRRLKEWLKGSTEWQEFQGTAVIRPILDGRGNLEESFMERETGRFAGMATQLYDPTSDQWTLYWADSVNGAAPYPVIGRFENGRGEFYAHEPVNGTHIHTRAVWQSLSPTECYWEQAFSADGGKTWETNWVMDFTRTDTPS